jgi:DNA-binding NtrC family response regulator
MSQRILIVDDEADMREVIQENLLDLGVEFVHAADGRQALDAIHSGTFDLILSDYKMPEFDGIELLKTLNERGNKVPVIWLSGHADKAMFREAWKYGVYDFFAKPVDFAAFRAAAINALKMGKNYLENSPRNYIRDRETEEVRIVIEKKLYLELQEHALKTGSSVATCVSEMIAKTLAPR